MEKKKGPSAVIIPKQRYMSCYGCKWLKTQMIRSGRNPEYGSSCIHPDNEKEYSIIRGIQGREIPNIDSKIETPDWCPILIATLKMIDDDRSEEDSNNG